MYAYLILAPAPAGELGAQQTDTLHTGQRVRHSAFRSTALFSFAGARADSPRLTGASETTFRVATDLCALRLILGMLIAATRMRTTRALLLAMFALLPAAPRATSAQVIFPQSGERVRVLVGTRSAEYEFLGWHADTLVFQDLHGPTRVQVSFASVAQLAVRRPRSRGRGAAHGAGIGALFGFGGGVLAGMISGDDEGDCWVCATAGEKAIGYAVLLAGAGALGGAIIGAAAPGHYWERMTLPARVDVAPAPGRAVVLSLSWRM